MSRIRIGIIGSAKHLKPSISALLLDAANKANVTLVFLSDQTISSIVDGGPVISYATATAHLATDNVDELIKFIESYAEPDFQNFEMPEEEEVEEDNYRKITHLERGGFLGRGKRGGINYRR